MSRIEEALKRASKGTATTDTVSYRDRFALATKPRARVDARVDDYATESESPVVHESAPVVARPYRAQASTTSIQTASTTRTTSVLTKVPEVVEGRLVSLQGTDPTSIEQYRRLAATLHGLQQQNGIKVLMVTSSV